MQTSPPRVAATWALRQEARRVASVQLPRIARRSKAAAEVRAELTVEVLEAFASSTLERVASDPRLAFGIGKRLEVLWKAFQTSPKAWADFKKMLGIKGDSWITLVRELPSKIKAFGSNGKKALESMGKKLADSVPALRMYLDAADKLPALGDWLGRAMDYLPPGIARTLKGIHNKATSLAGWVDNILSKHPVAKTLGTLVSAAIFAYVWFNVVEVSWDMPELIRGFTGGFSFVELLHSLPESAVGLVLRFMFPGLPSGLLWNAILPITVAMRLAWMHREGILEFGRGAARIKWDRLGVPDPGL